MSLTLKVLSSVREVDPDLWNLCAGTHPFVQHAFLQALEESGAVGPKRGVLPRYVLVYDEADNLLACVPGMLKWGTLREYGPEAIWLKQGLAEGCFSWPKFQLGVPFFPTMGPRILRHSAANKTLSDAVLLKVLRELGPSLGARQSFNVMYVDADALAQHGALLSREYQSMWTNAGYIDLKDYLTKLPKQKRYEFLKERHCAEAQGLAFRCLHGLQITEQMLSNYYEGHRRVCERHGNYPWLPDDAYRRLVEALGDSACLFGYFDEQSRMVAGMLGVHDRAERVLYLFQWSELEKRPGLALDLICRRPIDYAIAHGVCRIDSGLDAPHKALRGWQRYPVFNGHWFNDERLKLLAQNCLRA